MCYRSCHACAAEQRYRHHLQQQQQQAECAYCSCSQARAVGPRVQSSDRQDAATSSVYFAAGGLPPPVGTSATTTAWLRRPPAPVKARGTPLTTTTPGEDDGGTVGSSCGSQVAAAGRCSRDDDVDDNDDYDDAAGKRTMSTSLSSRSSSRTRRLRGGAAEVCRRARRAAAVADCCRGCWPRRLRHRAAGTSTPGTATAVDPLHRSTIADIDLCVQTTHDAHSDTADAAAATTADGKPQGRKLPSTRRAARFTTKWNANADRRRTILLAASFLIGLFLVSTALLTGFVVLWPSHRRRHSISGIIPTPFYAR